MATQNDFYRSFAVNAAMSANRRVALSTNGAIGYADASTLGIGILQNDVTSNSYEVATVRLFGTGTCTVSLSAIATAADTLICTASGQVCPKGSVTNGITFGRALSGAAASPELIEAVPLFYAV